MSEPRRVVVFGAGLVGGPMAIDLAKDPAFTVTVCDRSEAALDRLRAANLGIETRVADLSDAAVLADCLARADLAINAVPGFMGYATLKGILESGTNVVDIAFFPEDCFELDALAKEHGVVAIVDCGVAPGMSNLLCGYGTTLLDETHIANTYVGGLPEVRRWPYEYKAVFSPIDVIEEYTRPARYVENGHLVVRPALSDTEYMEFPGVGTLEAFNSDGLRTLAKTLDCANMKEKTLRYPGHVEKMHLFREAGFFSEEEIEVRGQKVRPIDVTAKLMFADWKLEEGEADITVMRIVVEGLKGEKRVRYTWDLHDRYDPETNTHSMARTTGYTATVALRLLAAGLYDTAGVSPPELVGQDPRCVEFMLEGLAARGVRYHESRVELE